MSLEGLKMSKFNINDLIKKKQNKYLGWGVSITSVIIVSSIVLISTGDEPSKKSAQSAPNMTGSPIDESFTESNAESAISAIQLESKGTVQLVKGFESRLKQIEDENNKKIDDLKALIQEGFKKQNAEQKKGANQAASVQNAQFWHQQNTPSMPIQSFQEGVNNRALVPINPRHTEVEHYKWSYEASNKTKHYRKSINNYIPSGSYASAIVLLGADANASVNGVSDQQAMTFKLTSPVHLPNNRRTNIKGCFLTGNAYGDISSERAYATIQKISCANPGKPIIDKKVDGWIAFKGKGGIKGNVSMRDGKVLTWAGISGALSGFASVAQASQSVQSISPLGATQTIPTNKMFSASGYAGAANAMDRLSNYYIKRADQYHPVVQIGAGNEVEVIFKKGFFLYSDEDEAEKGRKTAKTKETQKIDPENFDPNTFSVSQSVLDKMDKTNQLSLGQR
jgi:conjugal transfer pilus assembly protein TraB